MSLSDFAALSSNSFTLAMSIPAGHGEQWLQYVHPVLFSFDSSVDLSVPPTTAAVKLRSASVACKYLRSSRSSSLFFATSFVKDFFLSKQVKVILRRQIFVVL